MESADNFFDSEDEVRKLQELVKRLERQNEQLRLKQKPSDSLPNGDAVSFVPNNNQTDSEDLLRTETGKGALEDVDVLDVDNLSLKDEEDSWLYSSPKPPTPQQTNINLYTWVRQDFDHPSPEMESARRSLLFKLEEAAHMNRCSSSPISSSPTLNRSNEQSQKSYSRPHQKRSLLSMTGNRADAGALARTKKSYSDRRPPAVEGEEEKFHSHGVTDVERLAKEQEESLRQSMATYTSPKRAIHNKSMYIASDTDNSGSPVGSNRSSPARYEYEGSSLGRHRNSFGSDTSTPPDSPHVMMQHGSPLSEIHHSPGQNILNKSHLQYPPPSSHSSNSSLELQTVDSAEEPVLSSELRSTTRLMGPGFRSASPAMGGVRPGLSSSAISSPQRSGLPTPKRGIPRPASSAVRSSLPTLRRSGIPSAKHPSSQSREDSWREGCF